MSKKQYRIQFNLPSPDKPDQLENKAIRAASRELAIRGGVRGARCSGDYLAEALIFYELSKLKSRQNRLLVADTQPVAHLEPVETQAPVELAPEPEPKLAQVVEAKAKPELEQVKEPAPAQQPQVEAQAHQNNPDKQAQQIQQQMMEQLAQQPQAQGVAEPDRSQPDTAQADKPDEWDKYEQDKINPDLSNAPRPTFSNFWS